MTERPAADVLRQLEVTVDVADDDVVVGAVVLLKVVTPNNETGLVIGANEQLDWLSQRGIVAAAVDHLSTGFTDHHP